MTPVAEIWVPEGVNEKNLTKLLELIGSRVEEFPELKPIPVGEISPFSMTTFLKKFRPGLKFGRQPTYPQIFSELRDLPLDKQKELLVGFYSQGVEAFPNGKELGVFLAKLNNIHWFQPEIQPDMELLKNLCQQTLSRLNLPDLPLRIIKKDFRTAWDAAGGAVWDTVWVAAWNAARDAAGGAVWIAARDAAWDAVWGVARGAAWNAARDAAGSAVWIVGKDLMPSRGYNTGNPFEPLVEIYKLGYWPIGIVLNQNGEKEFAVFIPPIPKTA